MNVIKVVLVFFALAASPQLGWGKALVVLVDNGSVSKSAATTLEYTAQFMVTNNLSGVYDRIVFLTGKNAAAENFFKTLDDEYAIDDVVDAMILTHGTTGNITITNGPDIDAKMIENNLCASVRFLYVMSCYGQSLADAWIRAGVQTVVTHKGNNVLPAFFFPLFLKYLSSGWSAFNSANEAFLQSQDVAGKINHYNSIFSLKNIIESAPNIKGPDLNITDGKNGTVGSHFTIQPDFMRSLSKNSGRKFNHQPLERTLVRALVNTIKNNMTVQDGDVPGVFELFDQAAAMFPYFYHGRWPNWMRIPGWQISRITETAKPNAAVSKFLGRMKDISLGKFSNWITAVITMKAGGFSHAVQPASSGNFKLAGIKLSEKVRFSIRKTLLLNKQLISANNIEGIRFVIKAPLIKTLNLYLRSVAVDLQDETVSFHISDWSGFVRFSGTAKLRDPSDYEYSSNLIWFLKPPLMLALPPDWQQLD